MCDPHAGQGRKVAAPDGTFVWAMLLVSSVTIAIGAMSPVNGHDMSRQADTLAHILGFVADHPLPPLTSFSGDRTIYDFPIYQWTVARLAALAQSDPLIAARCVNIALWVCSFLLVVRMSEAASAGAGPFAAFLMGTSPLLLHFHTTPLPDVLAIALSLAGVYGLLRPGRWGRALGLALLCGAALVKSPVAFVFAVFCFVWLALGPRASRPSWTVLGLWALALAASAIAAELVRRQLLASDAVAFFAQDPAWYFGSLDQRLGGAFWRRFLRSTVGAPFPTWQIGVAVMAMAAVLLLRSAREIRGKAPVLVAVAAGVLAGWLVFANLHFLRLYYPLPAAVLTFLGLAVILSTGLSAGWRARARLRWSAPWRTALRAVALLAAVGLIVFGRGYRDLDRLSDEVVLDVLLPQDAVVLYIDGDYIPRSTEFGGQVQRLFRHATPAELEGGAVSPDDHEVVVVRRRAGETVPTFAAHPWTLVLRDYLLWARTAPLPRSRRMRRSRRVVRRARTRLEAT